MRVSIEQFFIEKAAAFTMGRYVDLAAQLNLPMTIPVGSKRLEMRVQRDVVQFLTAYRQNLLIEGYQKTACDILHVEVLPDDARQVLLRWRNLSAQRRLLSSSHVSYFCTHDAAGTSWVIDMIEVIDEASPRLTEGLQLI